MPQEHRPRQEFPSSARLRSPRQFQHVFQKRIFVADSCITLYAAPSDEKLSRIGISVGRRYGNAVQRNRFKRRIREAFRQIRCELPAGLDFIVVPKPGSESSVEELRHSLRRLSALLATRFASNIPHNR